MVWILPGKTIRLAAAAVAAVVPIQIMLSTNTTAMKKYRPAHWVTLQPYRSPLSWCPTTEGTVAIITPSPGRCTDRRRPTAGTWTAARLRLPTHTTTGPPARTPYLGRYSSRPSTTATTRTGRLTGRPAVASPIFSPTSILCLPRGNTLAR